MAKINSLDFLWVVFSNLGLFFKKMAFFKISSLNNDF